MKLRLAVVGVRRVIIPEPHFAIVVRLDLRGDPNMTSTLRGEGEGLAPKQTQLTPFIILLWQKFSEFCFGIMRADWVQNKSHKTYTTSR